MSHVATDERRSLAVFMGVSVVTSHILRATLESNQFIEKLVEQHIVGPHVCWNGRERKKIIVFMHTLIKDQIVLDNIVS